MKKLIVISVIAAALFGLAENIRAEDAFVRVTTTPDELDLGTSPIWGEYESPSVLTVNVESNCPHGSIVASITTLKNRKGGAITPDRIFIETEVTGGFVPMTAPVRISEPAAGSHNIQLKVKVNTNIGDRAGNYSGALMFTIAPLA